MGMQIKKITNDAIIQDILKYSAFLTEKGRKASTIKRYCYDLEDCFHYLTTEKKDFSSNVWATFTSDDYERFFLMLTEERNYSDKTLHRIYVALNKFFAFLVENDKSIENPIPILHLNIHPDRSLTKDDFISLKEQERLFLILKSSEGLSEKQLQARSFLYDRNTSIVKLMLTYGLTLKEIVSLRMNDIHFEQNIIDIHGTGKRVISLSPEDKQILYAYYKIIPEPVRPAYHSEDPFFVAFDFNRNTYRWVYETDSPKALTEIAVQKMIRLEVARAGLRKGICAQHFRNTFILHLIQQQCSEEIMMQRAGLTSKISLKRYFEFAERGKGSLTGG